MEYYRKTVHIFKKNNLTVLVTNNFSVVQWRRQTRGVGCVRTPCHEDALHNIFEARFCISQCNGRYW